MTELEEAIVELNEAVREIKSFFSQKDKSPVKEILPDIDPTPMPFDPPEYYDPDDEYDDSITVL